MVYCPEDTAAPLADFGVAVQVDGGAGTTGWIRRGVDVQRELGVEVPMGSNVLTIEAGTLGAIVMDQKLSIAGVWYRYRGPIEGVQDRFDHVAVVQVPV